MWGEQTSVHISLGVESHNILFRLFSNWEMPVKTRVSYYSTLKPHEARLGFVEKRDCFYTVGKINLHKYFGGQSVKIW